MKLIPMIEDVLITVDNSKNLATIKKQPKNDIKRSLVKK